SGSQFDMAYLGIIYDVLEFLRVGTTLDIAMWPLGFLDFVQKGDWFSFAKRRAPSPVCIDDNRSFMKHWKSGFFLIDRRAILNAMIWRHSDAAIDDPRPATGSFSIADMCQLIMGIYDFLCLPEWTVDDVISDPTLEDLVVGTPSSKILAKAEVSQKRKASISGDSDDESDGDDDACVDFLLVTPLYFVVVIPCLGNQRGSFATPAAKDSRGKGIMADAAVASSVDSRGKGIMADAVVASSVADSKLKGYVEKVASLTGLELQVSTLKKQVFGHSDKLSSYDASFTKSKAKGKEGKKKIKSLTKSLDNLHTEVARLSNALNQANVLEAEKDEEIIWLKATPLEVQGELLSFTASAGFEKFLAFDEFSRVQGELLSFTASAGFELEPEKLVRPVNFPTSRDTRVFLPIAMDLTVTPISKSLELSANIDLTASIFAFEHNEDMVNVKVDGPDLKMTDDTVAAKSGHAFVQGFSVALDDAVELVKVRSGRVSSDPNDVVVALFVGEKGDGLVPSSSFFCCWGGACGMPENICCSELEAN
nr:hypothetical protein [Tanacetum cinerariifolium]